MAIIFNAVIKDLQEELALRQARIVQLQFWDKATHAFLQKFSAELESQGKNWHVKYSAFGSASCDDKPHEPLARFYLHFKGDADRVSSRNKLLKHFHAGSFQVSPLKMSAGGDALYGFLSADYGLPLYIYQPSSSPLGSCILQVCVGEKTIAGPLFGKAILQSFKESLQLQGVAVGKKIPKSRVL